MTQKEIAVDFLRRAAKGGSREAFRDYGAPGFRHHNPWFRGDADTLAAAMEDAARHNPGKILEVQRAIEEGDLVAVHSFVRQSPEDKGGAVVHIFRFEGGKIAELWDVGQAVPDGMENEHGMF